MSTPISQTLAQRTTVTTVTTGSNKFDTTVTVVGTKYRETDTLYDELRSLINHDVKWRPWYCKRFHALGRDRVLQLAAIARADGLTPCKLFSKLLKAG